MASSDHRIPAHLQSKRDLDGGLAIFRFELEDHLAFKPGQYATLWLTYRGKTTPRPYSIASSPSEKRVLEFYINLVETGHLTPSLWSPEIVRSLQLRDAETQVSVTGPKGRFLLDPNESRHLVFVASGTGLAPFMSMIRTLNEDFRDSPRTFRRRSVCVIHGVSRPRHLGYREELERLAAETLVDPGRQFTLSYLPTVSRPHLDPSWTGLTGRAETLFECDSIPASGIHSMQGAVRSLLNSTLRPETHLVCICGYPGTVDSVVRLLSARGFKPDLDLKREKYYP